MKRSISLIILALIMLVGCAKENASLKDEFVFVNIDNGKEIPIGMSHVDVLEALDYTKEKLNTYLISSHSADPISSNGIAYDYDEFNATIVYIDEKVESIIILSPDDPQQINLKLKSGIKLLDPTTKFIEKYGESIGRLYWYNKNTNKVIIPSNTENINEGNIYKCNEDLIDKDTLFLQYAPNLRDKSKIGYISICSWKYLQNSDSFAAEVNK